MSGLFSFMAVLRPVTLLDQRLRELTGAHSARLRVSSVRTRPGVRRRAGTCGGRGRVAAPARLGSTVSASKYVRTAQNSLPAFIATHDNPRDRGKPEAEAPATRDRGRPGRLADRDPDWKPINARSETNLRRSRFACRWSRSCSSRTPRRPCRCAPTGSNACCARYHHQRVALRAARPCRPPALLPRDRSPLAARIWHLAGLLLPRATPLASRRM